MSSNSTRSPNRPLARRMFSSRWKRRPAQSVGLSARPRLLRRPTGLRILGRFGGRWPSCQNGIEVYVALQGKQVLILPTYKQGTWADQGDRVVLQGDNLHGNIQEALGGGNEASSSIRWVKHPVGELASRSKLAARLSSTAFKGAVPGLSCPKTSSSVLTFHGFWLIKRNSGWSIIEVASRNGCDLAPVPRISTKSGPFSPGEWSRFSWISSGLLKERRLSW